MNLVLSSISAAVLSSYSLLQNAQKVHLIQHSFGLSHVRLAELCPCAGVYPISCQVTSVSLYCTESLEVCNMPASCHLYASPPFRSSTSDARRTRLRKSLAALPSLPLGYPILHTCQIKHIDTNYGRIHQRCQISLL